MLNYWRSLHRGQSCAVRGNTEPSVAVILSDPVDARIDGCCVSSFIYLLLDRHDRSPTDAHGSGTGTKVA